MQPYEKSSEQEIIEKFSKPAEQSGSSKVRESKDWRAISRQKQARREPIAFESSDRSIFSLRDIVHVLFKRKIQIVIFFFAVVITVAVGTFVIKPDYEASAEILVKLGRERVFVPAMGDTRPIIDYSREEWINSEIEIITSRSLAEKVVLIIGPTVISEDLRDEEPGFFGNIFKHVDRIWSQIKVSVFQQEEEVMTPDELKAFKVEEAIAILQEDLEVEGVKKSNIIEIRFVHEYPQVAALLVNTLAEVYLDHRLEIHKTTKSQKFFYEQSEVLKSKLEHFENRLKSLKEEYNVTSLREETSLLLNHEATLQADMNRTLSQGVETERRIRQLRQQLNITPKTIAQGEVIDRNQQLIGILEARLVELELKEKELLAKYTDNSRQVQNVREEIKIVKEKLAVQEKKSYGRKSSGINPTYQILQQEFYRYEAELNAIKAKGQIQKTQLADYESKLQELNQVDLKLSQLEQQVEVERQNYRLYLTKFEESRISNAMDTEKISGVSIIEPARTPLEPVSPNKMLNLALALFVGSFGGLGLAFFMDFLDDKLERVEDVEECLDLPVLASIPEMQPKKQQKA